MTKRILKLRNVVAIAICLAAMAMVMSGCPGGDGYPVITDKDWKTTVTFVNNSSEEIHLYGEGETGGPDNKLKPGGSRTKTFTEEAKFTPTTSFTVTAFRNGAVVSKHSFPRKFDGWNATLTASYPW